MTRIPNPSGYLAVIDKNLNINWVAQESALAVVNGAPAASLLIQGVTVTTADYDATKYTIVLSDPGAASQPLSSSLDGTTLTVSLETDIAGTLISTTSDIATEIATHSEFTTAGGDVTLAVAETATLSRSGVNCEYGSICMVVVRPIAATAIDIRVWGVHVSQNTWDALDGVTLSGVGVNTSIAVDTKGFDNVYVEVTVTDDTMDALVGVGS